MVFGAGWGFRVEEVEAEGVFIQFGFVKQAGFESNPFFFAKLALKNGFLNADTVVGAGAGNAAKASGATFIGGGDIVGDENKHDFYLGMSAGYSDRSPRRTRARSRAWTKKWRPMGIC